MRLAHATLGKLLPAIQREGLRKSKSQTAREEVWLGCPSRAPWAILHTVKRHGGRVEDVVVIAVDIPRGWLRRRAKGLWTVDRDIPPERFRGVTGFAVVSVSPMEVDPCSR